MNPNPSTINIALAQFGSVNPKKLDNLLSIVCEKQKLDLVVFGEYVANRFFKEYSDKATLKNECEIMKAYFGELSAKFGAVIVVPLIECVGLGKNQKFYKSIAIFEAGKMRFYRASRLMDFPHWNECAFFDNAVVDSSVDSRPKMHFSRPKEPLIFSVGGFKVSAIFGWEAHFDEIFAMIRKKSVDILCVPTANTFGSNARWQRLMQTRSFLNNCFVVRVNRVGSFIENGSAWDFYGESFIAFPDGNLGDMMGAKEGILVSEIRSEVLKEAKGSWKFR